MFCPMFIIATPIRSYNCLLAGNRNILLFQICVSTCLILIFDQQLYVLCFVLYYNCHCNIWYLCQHLFTSEAKLLTLHHDQLEASVCVMWPLLANHFTVRTKVCNDFVRKLLWHHYMFLSFQHWFLTFASPSLRIK